MSEFIIVNIVLFSILALLFLLLSWMWPPDSPWSPWWKTDKKAGRAAIKLGKISKKDVVYELGSGDGEFALLVAREIGAKVVGIEIDPLRFLISRIRQLLNNTDGKVIFLKKDFKKVNISPASVVFVYLVPRALERITPKLLDELKPGTRIISYRYKIPNASENKIQYKGVENKNLFYLYQI